MTGQLPLEGRTTSPPPPSPRDIPPPTPTEQRRLLVNGAADFNRNHPPGPGEPQTAEEQVDEALARGVVRLQTQEALLDRHDAIEADADGFATQRLLSDRGAATLDVGSGGYADRFARRDMVLCPAQDQIAVTFNADGDLTITQRSSMGESEDQEIHVAKGNIGTFIDLLTDALGIPSFP